MKPSTCVNYDTVAQAASTMLQHGSKPTVRAVMAVTGGKTETVAQLLRDFHDKRNAEVLRMADELGSSTMAKLLADEVQTVVDRRTASLKDQILELTERLNESIELLSEKENDCQHRIELAEAHATQRIHDAELRANAAEARIDAAETLVKNAKAELQNAEQNAIRDIQETKAHADLLVSNAQNEARALANAADKRTEKAETETASLREQVKALSIDEATRQLERQQVLDAQLTKDTLKDALSDTKAKIAQLEQALKGAEKDNTRLESDLAEFKIMAKQLPTALAELNEANKQVTFLREKEEQRQKE